MSWKEELIIQTVHDKVIIHDVAIGDVSFPSGQSNMKFYMRYEKHYNEELHSDLNLTIRYFEHPPITYKEQINKADYFKYYGYWRRYT